MFEFILRKILGTKHERELKRLQPMVAAINALEPQIKALTDAQLRAKTGEFRQQLSQGAKLDDILFPAFAVCREAGRRALGMRHFDVQLVGGIVLHQGKIAEMKTGEGKTLVATLACYLNALEGKGVHVVTVNDYLAKRDAEWMGKLYNFLGLSVGTVVHSQYDSDKKQAYAADITYGQNNEYGFDYMRDNMKFSIYDYCQRELNFAIVDEVDSILIDEARTPLIISGPGETASEKYVAVSELIPRLRKEEHYTLDEKHHSVTLTEEGIEHAQRLLREKGLLEHENLYEPVNLEVLHLLYQSLRAHTLYKRDQHYMVTEDGRVMIIDEFTGRVLPGRRWSEGLHQAVEAKERVPIQDENRTLATISFQNFFRLYRKLAGMTGTADTEATEFHKIYNLDVSVIPTNRAVSRIDAQDLVYKTEREKFKAVANEIKDAYTRGQPVLVGTTSVEKSDALSRILTRSEIPHHVLNAKQHEREAYIVAQAGRRSSVTVATNMAGRGTDIVLGGNPEMLGRLEVMEQGGPAAFPSQAEFDAAVAAATEKYRAISEQEKKEVLAAGGLHIVGTERHESRRIDNQLRGRSGRQGDPGSSRFYLSLEDDLMRIFAGERLQNLMDRLGMEEDIPIEHPWVTKAVENAQRKVEERNFDIRKHLLEYDDVLNQQRKSIYALRRQVLEGQYRTVPSDEERKKGVESKSFVTTTNPALRERIEPIIGQMVRHHAAGRPPEGADDAALREHYERAQKRGLDELTELDVNALQRDVYLWFGCRIELNAFAQRPREAHAHLLDAVAFSLTEQRERMLDIVDELIGIMVEHACPENKQPEDWDYTALSRAFKEQFDIAATGIDRLGDANAIAQKLFTDAEAIIQRKEREFGAESYLRLFRNFYLQEIDRQWLEHLQNMDGLREGIGLRGYGQRDPKKEYKREGYALFIQMTQGIKGAVANKMFRVERLREEDVERLEEQRRNQARAQAEQIRMTHPGEEDGAPADEENVANRRTRRRAAQAGAPSAPPRAAEAVRRQQPKIGRNDPCWCGSGKKYKQCHLKSDERGGGPADSAPESTDEESESPVFARS